MTTNAQQHLSWTSRGADTAAQATYASIRVALKEIMTRRDVEVFLQGSYANHTNVRADSDVDIVVMTKQVFTGDFNTLSYTSRLVWDRLPTATYSVAQLRIDVYDALKEYYGESRVHIRNKCILVDGFNGRVDADVVPCMQYRWFTKPDATISTDYIEGIQIQPLEGSTIINFPKSHIRNGEAKNSNAYGEYKATVRQMKRLRTFAVDNHFLRDRIAPGYLLECMTYNAPDERFQYGDSDRLMKVLSWLKYADKSKFLACDRIHTLFGTDPGGFSIQIAQEILDALWEAY
jgi:predicted nucleotidyltransferase